MFKPIFFSLLVSILFITSSCKEESTQSSFEVISTDVYGTDDRYEIGDVNSSFAKYGKSVAGMVRKSYLTSFWDGDMYIPRFFSMGSRFNTCSNVPFRNQNSLASCTGVMVGYTTLLTAGHCIETEEDCRNFYWVFGYQGNNFFIPGSNVFTCKKILRRKLNLLNGLDYTFIRLGRRNASRFPQFDRRRSSYISRGDRVFTIGHPTGLPMKYTTNAYVRKNNEKNVFETNLDTFAGNSGSPVFSRSTGKLEGILVSGKDDFVFNKEKNCNEINYCDDDKCSGEAVVRINQIYNDALKRR